MKPNQIASALVATAALCAFGTNSIGATSQPPQSNVWYFWCTGISPDQRKSVQTNYFTVYTNDLQRTLGRRVAGNAMRQAALEQQGIVVPGDQGYCSYNQSSPQDFNEERYAFEASMRDRGYMQYSVHVYTIND